MSAGNTEIALLIIPDTQEKELLSRQENTWSDFAPQKQPRNFQLQYIRLKWSLLEQKCKLKTAPV